MYRRALEDRAWFGRSKVFIIPFSKSFPSVVHGAAQHLEDLLQTREEASKWLGGCAGEAMDGVPSQGSTVGFALVILVECRWAGHQAQMLPMEVAQVASTLSNNNRHPILPQIFREACYARGTERSLLSPGL